MVLIIYFIFAVIDALNSCFWCGRVGGGVKGLGEGDVNTRTVFGVIMDLGLRGGGNNSGMEGCVGVGTGLVERDIGDKVGIRNRRREGSAWGN